MGTYYVETRLVDSPAKELTNVPLLHHSLAAQYPGYACGRVGDRLLITLHIDAWQPRDSDFFTWLVNHGIIDTWKVEHQA